MIQGFSLSDKKSRKLILTIALGYLPIQSDEHSLLGIYQSLRGFWQGNGP
jgi:hypothetical protein